ncbi:sodium:proton antiporter [Paenibacillus filicis]|uniref:Nickel/cobalt efflux system n=1 Tax=Paenibacillus gyeongsangnamensis TaxID=3388067 RepID=A0ABT4QGI5_9BACL|nr:sodium:proton antiporter [Paenibacillus filicis]MCZ8515979.1 sodium:proton antiporter [Paenibacillus filicis]
MSAFSLIFLVFVLGLRHGLDADHLAFIDGQIRYNWRMGSPIARWVGTLFSFGHGAVVAGMAIVLGMFIQDFEFPEGFDTFATWASIVSLLLIGSINLFNLIRSKQLNEDFQIQGYRGKFVARIVKGTTNPFMIILVGAVFALAAETISQTSVWALAAGNKVEYMPVVLGLVFMLGMMLTDTVDSLIAFRMLRHTGRLGRSASRLIGWIIVLLAYGVSGYEAFVYFNPWAELDFELVGIVIFIFLLLSFGWVTLRAKRQAQGEM